jgi:hypothetical protein
MANQYRTTDNQHEYEQHEVDARYIFLISNKTKKHVEQSVKEYSKTQPILSDCTSTLGIGTDLPSKDERAPHFGLTEYYFPDVLPPIPTEEEQCEAEFMLMLSRALPEIRWDNQLIPPVIVNVPF